VSLSFFVPGKPAAQGSKRALGPGRMIEQSKAVKPWRERVAWFALEATIKQAKGDPLAASPIPRTTPVALYVEFVMPRPASTPKRSTPPAIRQPDLDKCVRAIGDALTGIAWVDDAQVTSLTAYKRLAELDEGPGCHIEVKVAAGYGESLTGSAQTAVEKRPASTHQGTPESRSVSDGEALNGHPSDDPAANQIAKERRVHLR